MKNIYTMKQPKLGKKISELRKEKGLTQEELIEKCNVSIRTIQRIEAGEVTPRSYTLKAIFEALDYNFTQEKEANIAFEKSCEITSHWFQEPKPWMLTAFIFILSFAISFIDIASNYFYGINHYLFGFHVYPFKLVIFEQIACHGSFFQLKNNQ